MVGLFYQHSKQRSTEELVDPLGNSFFESVFGQSLEDYSDGAYGQDSYINNSVAKDKQIAGFADVTYAVTNRLKLNAGARYAKTSFLGGQFRRRIAERFAHRRRGTQLGKAVHARAWRELPARSQ